ncbi:ParB domain protein nuclease [Sulfolobus islandicus L.S.2.15]|uniref:ParB domain protein nuclease n=1 Tax=Saccharolobus islandicus (strain L.S.2.15 / Lassen \|nr:ParB N-terminal domain-containing protein [Sulfolobus islandicus]ACP36078.1 ParB domain protein nuclease [Sulfolobus islandicus L.S.2.15]
MTELTYTEEIVPIEKLREDEEFRSLVPPNNMKEQLTSSIIKNGQTLPIDVDSDNVILDGYTRASILRELKYKEVKVRKWSFRSQEDRATAYRLIAMLNLQRRHLEKNEVLKLLRELAEKIEKSSKEVQKLSANADNFEQNREINTKPRELEQKMKQVKEEVGAKEVSDSDIQEYSLISTIPYLRQLVDEGKISVRTAYELYKKVKDKLQKITSLPKYERDQLLTTKEGRKILLERDDLLQLILDHKMAVSQAINKIKTEEKLQRSEKKSRAKEEEEEEEEGETDEEEEAESTEGEDSESEEYDFVGEWQQAAKEQEKEVEQQLTPQLNANEINNDLESYLKQLVTEGFVEVDKTKLYLVTLDGKTYLINARAVNELKSGKGVGKYKKLEEFIQSKGLGFYDPEEGAYSISYQLLA